MFSDCTAMRLWRARRTMPVLKSSSIASLLQLQIFPCSAQGEETSNGGLLRPRPVGFKKLSPRLLAVLTLHYGVL
eukprot:2510674-Amphidinium_carterae.1